MRRFLSLVLLLGCLALSPVRAADSDTKLFNGKDLTGWRVYLRGGKGKASDCFSVKDNMIVCSGKPAGYIITEKEYGDYKLTLEWKWGAGAKKVKVPNSGVLLHVSGKDNIWPKSAEAQLMAGHAGDFWLIGGYKLTVDKERQDKRTARHFFRMGKDKKIEKPLGEWNKYEIVCKGNTISLSINGEKVNEGTMGELKKGKIALQSEGAPISFRNITITPLK